MQKICWVLTIIGVLFGSCFFVITLIKSNGAPQEAAGAAISLCFVIIPYVLARAVEKININIQRQFTLLFVFLLWVTLHLFLLLNANHSSFYKPTDFFIPFEKEYRDFISFQHYDWSEFLVYTISPFIIYIFYYIFKKRRKNKFPIESA